MQWSYTVSAAKEVLKISDQKESNKPRIVTDITAFKSSLPLFPLAQPFVHLEELVRSRP